MSRQKFDTRTILLRAPMQRDALLALVANLPLDADKPLQVVVREEVKARKPDQNALMWSGPLKDIAQQAWVLGRQYSDVVWHEHFKTLFLPDDFDPELCKEGYRKLDVTPTGKQVLVGSTTELTVKGFALYLEQVYAEGANMGVEFSANPKEQRRAA